MNVTDKVCSLECIKKGGNVHEFVGPVKIVLVDPPEDQYNRRKSGAAFVALANLMIGANTFFMVLFTFGFKLPTFINLHILLCTLGLQFCMPLAILMMHSLQGAAAPLKKSQRKLEHFFLHFIGLACSVTGSVLAILLGEKSVIDPPEEFSSLHFFSGCVALGLAVLAVLIGPCLLCTASGCFVFMHRFFGVMAFAASSVCFVFGIIKPTMQLWLYIVGYMAPTYIIVFFTAFYTLVVIITPLTKCCGSPNKNEKPKSILRKKRIKRQPVNRPSTPTKPSPNLREDAPAEPSKQRHSLKFSAPIKIIVIDPKSEYCKSVWCAIGIALTNVAIGAVLMSVLHYSIVKNDAHAVVCTFAYHFFSAEAILSLHYANGWSSPMRTRHRKFAHFFLQICAIICGIIGTSIAIIAVGIDEGLVEKPHGFIGILTGILVILSAIFGPLAYYRRKKCVQSVHMSLGITAFVMSSLCVCFGLTLEPFKTWAGQTVVYLLLAFVIYYTVFIVTGSFMKCMSRF